MCIFANKYTFYMFSETELDNVVKTIDGSSVCSYEYLDSVRSAEMKNVESKNITPQKGGQEICSIDVDILIGGGREAVQRPSPCF
jgi:hypothetical protein